MTTQKLIDAINAEEPHTVKMAELAIITDLGDLEQVPDFPRPHQLWPVAQALVDILEAPEHEPDAPITKLTVAVRNAVEDEPGLFREYVAHLAHRWANVEPQLVPLLEALIYEAAVTLSALGRLDKLNADRAHIQRSFGVEDLLGGDEIDDE
ncbi:hypothetical protein ACMHYT_30325 [Rhodococcus qingshengii]|uniref:hypothetical protein n=1 Tax=Rhodococcus qingshengii TaxID=334542 RepID=UPI0039C48449